jgi:hypothetical protein
MEMMRSFEMVVATCKTKQLRGVTTQETTVIFTVLHGVTTQETTVIFTV